MFVLLSVGASDTCKKTEEMVEVEWRLKCLFFLDFLQAWVPKETFWGYLKEIFTG